MRTIDILVSAASDVQKESAIAEHLICSLAAEFDLPVSISYSNRLRGAKEDAAVERKDPEDESTPVLRLFFWDCPALERDDLPEPDQTQYDLVICLLWSRLISVPVEKWVSPNGSLPLSATNYEIGSILGQSHQISQVQKLRVYRNRATPDSLLEPKAEREEMCQQWDAVQDFFARWEKDDEIEFRERCHEFLDLEEFANLFRQHFRDFLIEQLDGGIDPKKVPVQNRFRGSNPFLGLNFFNFEHAAFYYGRTKAIGEVLDALKKQATARKSFVLVLGPSGSGKSSLLRAGVLPLLTRGGTPVGNGPWSRAITRPGVGDPIDTLAAALEAKLALPEPPDSGTPDESLSLASRLKKDPENAASQIAEVLGKTKMRLALVVDQLEELFFGVSPVLQRKYVTALCALARCDGIYVMAALRSEFYAHYQRFPELVNLTSGGGRYELQLPAEPEIANMIRLPAEAAGLRFERDSETGRSLDDFLLKAAANSSDPLPLLEHVLSRLYNRQLDRKDGLLLWSDYCQFGRFKNALVQHAETVFLALNRDEQSVFKLVVRQLLAPGAGKENVLIRRPVPYHDLVSSPKLNHRQSAAARSVIDCLTNEGLLSADTDSKHCRLISFPQEVLLNNWPTLWRSLSEDQHFFGMRGRLDESLRLWLSRGAQSNHLLHDRIALAEAETLLRDFGSELSENQIDYIQKSLARQKRRGRARNYLGLAAVIVLAVFAVIVAAEQFNSASQRNQTKQDGQAVPPDGSLSSKDTTALEAQLKEAQEKVELAQQNAELANRQRTALETELKTAADKLNQVQDAELTDSKGKALQTPKEAEEKPKQVRGNSDEMSSQLSALQVQLKQEQNKAQKAQADADSLGNTRNALQSQLKQAEAKALLAQQNADLVSNQRSALETQLKETEEKLKQAQANPGAAASQLGALQAQLKQEQDKEQKAQANADSLTSERNAWQDRLKATEEKLSQAQGNSEAAAIQLSAFQAQLKQEQEKQQTAQAKADALTSERNALQSQLKQAEAKALLAQQNADLVSSQRGALETQLQEAEEKLKQTQTNSGDAAGQLSALQAQVKQEQDKEKKAQANADASTSERNALQSQLKATQEKLNQAQANSGDAASQFSALQAQLKQEQDKEQKAQANADASTSERNALQSQLKQAEAKAVLAQQNADLVSSQRGALETQLQEAEEKLKQAQTNPGAPASQSGALQAQLKQEQDKEQKAQVNADELTNERNALQGQLKATQEKLNQAQANSGDAASQLSALQTQLKQEQDKELKAYAKANSLTGERDAIQDQLEQAEARALLAQQNAGLVNSQRSELEAQLKEAEEKLNQAQVNSGGAASQLSALQAQLKQEQDKGKKTQADADALTSERNGLQSQLKQAEAKALLAQQNADLVSSRQRTLETRLKEAEDKRTQAQANSGDAASQLNALQAQLKQEQEKGKKAQADADALTGERNSLQSQLKQAEAKALLAQQNADLVSSQQRTLETQLKEAKEKLKQAQANSGDAASQLNALQAQLKQEQEREQTAQANADALTSERNGLQSQLKQAEAKALLDQQSADLVISQRSALETQLKETQEKLKQAKASSGDTASQLSGVQARLYFPQSASPVPSPSTNPSETANPPESPSSGNDETSGNEESLKDFVLGYLRTVASNDTSVQRRYFAGQVSFYGRGVLDASNVEASTEEYHREWPIRQWTPRGEARIARLRHRDRFVVYQPFRWAVSDGSRHAQGNSTLYLRIQRDSQGEFRIVNVHQLDR
jgi:chromosome segregation ATPase